MAKPKTTTPAAAPTIHLPAAAPVALNETLLASIVAATKGDLGYGFGFPADLAPLGDAGFVLVNASQLHDDGAQIAVRATDEGIAHVIELQRQADAAAFAAQPQPQAAPTPPWAGGAAPGQPWAPPPAQPAPAPAAAPKAAPVPRTAHGEFELEDNIAPPTTVSRGGPRASVYPFETMNVGQSFFIACTADKPEPWKSFSSSVTSATTRYAVPSADGAMRKNRNGESVRVLTPTKVFKIFRGEKTLNDGTVQKGARVFRMA